MKSVNDNATDYNSVKKMSYQEWAVIEDKKRSDTIEKIRKAEIEKLKAKKK